VSFEATNQLLTLGPKSCKYLQKIANKWGVTQVDIGRLKEIL